MKLPLIQDNIVVNLVTIPDDAEIITQAELEQRIAAKQDVRKCYVPPVSCMIGPEGGKIGDTWDGTKYTSPPPPSSQSPEVPQVVSMFQAREVLAQAGYLDTVDAQIQATGGTALRAWEYATEVRRDSPLVATMAQQLGLTDEQVDQLFIQAAQITA